MKNTERDYISQGNGSNMTVEKVNPVYNKKQPDIADPDESEGKPAKILPIIDKKNKANGKNNKEAFNADNLNAGINEADEMDNSGSE